MKISEGSCFDHEPQISVSSTTPKRKIQPNLQNTVDGKEHFIRHIILPGGVNKTDKIQASPEFAHEYFFLTFPCCWRVTAWLQAQEGFANI